jgi:hypothetical protein
MSPAANAPHCDHPRITPRSVVDGRYAAAATSTTRMAGIGFFIPGPDDPLAAEIDRACASST